LDQVFDIGDFECAQFVRFPDGGQQGVLGGIPEKLEKGIGGFKRVFSFPLGAFEEERQGVVHFGH